MAKKETKSAEKTAEKKDKKLEKIKVIDESAEEIDGIVEEKLIKEIESEVKEVELKKDSKKDVLKDKDIDKEFLSLAKKKQLLVPLEDYVRSSIHLGTRVVMPDMRKYIYKKRADGLAILNTTLIDEKMREAIEYISSFKPEDIVLVCKRDAGWTAAYLFSDLTGIRVFTKKYPAGIITNLKLDTFFQPELIIVCDPWLDKNAMKDAVIANIPFVALCDSNNLAREAKMIIPCNNKSEKSLGMVFFILAKEYCKAHKLPFDKKLEDFSPTISETGK
jgi:small subunit ribosomal protein S2